VVDDAIVVVEAVHAKFEEEPNISPYNAVRKVLGEISGAIIAITLVMVSVFVPISFMSGPVGTFYRQFSITMASAIVISALIALTLTPVLCAMLLKNHHGHPKKKNILTRALDSFNRGFEKMTGRYVWLLKLIVSRRVVTFTVLLLFCAGIYYESKIVPSGFIRMRIKVLSMPLFKHLRVLHLKKQTRYLNDFKKFVKQLMVLNLCRHWQVMRS
jgi:HAE1 family hydrophobic/amphiphilic exporter-1